jgi:protein involved in polysaccharide export with SLBB domain
MRAIAQAGGFRDTARRTQVIVIRQNPDGPFFTTVLDITKVINGADKAQDISLMPYDIVYVPKSAIADVDLWVQQYVNSIIPGQFYYAMPYVVRPQ